MVRYHIQLHPNQRDHFLQDGKVRPDLIRIRFTSDGIPCSNSGSENLYVTALRFQGCKNVYILETRVAKRNQPKVLSEFLEPFVEEVLELQYPVEKFLGDAPIRSFFKCLKGRAGYYSCEVCVAEGECIDRKVSYPSSTFAQPRRDMADWISAVEEVEDTGCDSVRGITGRSPMLRIPNFDMIGDSPSDRLHRDFLGITKNLWRMCVNPNKHGTLPARAREMQSKVTKAYVQVRLPREFSHRSRAVDLANYKSHEWKSLLMTCFPVIADACQELRGGSSGLMWTLFAFLLRIYNGPEHYLDDIGEDTLRDLHKCWYQVYEGEFGSAACSFNIHAFSHLLENRRFGRQHEISTEAFESAYGMIQLSYHPGTRAIGKQILEHMLMRLLKRRSHNCEYTLKFGRFKAGKRYDDSIVCDERWNFYKVIEVHRDSVTVVCINKTHWTSPYNPDLPFDKAGVYQFCGYGQERLTYPKSHFSGKGAMFDKRLLMGLYWDLLFS